MYGIDAAGWYDPIPEGGVAGVNTAEIEKYDLAAYVMQPNVGGDVLAYSIQEAIDVKAVTPDPPTSLTISTEDEPGMFMVTLHVCDWATNCNGALSRIIADTSSELLINEDNQMNSPTASDPAKIWNTVIDREIEFSWDGYFYNSWLIDWDVTKAFPDAEDKFPDEYGQKYFYYPEAGWANWLGIHIFTYAIMKHEHEVPTNAMYINTTAEEFNGRLAILKNSCVDGEKFIVWMKVWDHKEQWRVEKREVYCDSTPPEIELFGVNYNGEQAVFAMSVEAFVGPVTKFSAWIFDVHSNIHDIYWRLGTSHNGSEVGEGYQAVVKHGFDVSYVTQCYYVCVCVCGWVCVCVSLFECHCLCVSLRKCVEREEVGEKGG